MRKLFISALVCLISPLGANAYTEANEFHGPVSTEGEAVCLDIAKYASVIMHERQYGTPKYALEEHGIVQIACRKITATSMLASIS